MRCAGEHPIANGRISAGLLSWLSSTSLFTHPAAQRLCPTIIGLRAFGLGGVLGPHKTQRGVVLLLRFPRKAVVGRDRGRSV